MSLREQAVEAMARSQFGAGWWESAGKHDRNDALKIAAEHLDALLEFLEAHTEEWQRTTFPSDDWDNLDGYEAMTRVMIQRDLALVAALRGTTEEPQ